MNLARTLVAVAALQLAVPASAADLSPARWAEAERARLQAAELRYDPPEKVVIQGRTLVAGTASRTAVHAGIEALRQGGTAADAAATVAITQVTMNLGSTISYAGKMALVYFEARTGRVYALDAGWGAYAQETDPGSIPDTDISAITGRAPATGADTGAIGRQTLVPGFMSGIEAMHARFGRLSFADLFQPAIWYADNGISLAPTQGFSMAQGRVGYLRQPRFTHTAEARRFASLPDGTAPKLGDMFPQADLARTLRGVASGGADYMYRGPWAHAYVEAVRAAGGKVTLSDLARYHATWRPVQSLPFAGDSVVGMDGGTFTCTILASLNLASAAGVERMGPYWTDPQAFKAYTRAIRFATHRGYGSVGEPAGSAQARGLGADCHDRLKPDYAAAVAPQIMQGQAVTGRFAAVRAGHHTQAVVVVDRWGNVAALVHTSNGSPNGIVVGGVPLTSAGAINKGVMASLRPGARLPNDLAPLIALRDGKPVLAIGAWGTSLVPETVRLVGEVLSGHADVQTAMTAPPLIASLTPPTREQTFWNWPELVPAGAYDAAFIKALAADGVPTEPRPPMQVLATLRGEAITVTIDRPSGAPKAAEAPGLGGFAEADGAP